jgi:urease accessory protein
MQIKAVIIKKIISGFLAYFIFVTHAHAHHPMGGITPTNMLDGLLSGLGHPIIGLDHLAFILAVSLIVAVMKLPIKIPLFFAIASTIGVLGQIIGLEIPAVENAILLSILVVGAALVRGKNIASSKVAVVITLFGLFHGYAFGEAIIGAEPTPIISYLVGLAMVELLIIYSLIFTIRAVGLIASDLASRLAGASVAGVGVLLILIS